MGSSYGENIKLTIFGQSHSEAIGLVLEGLPAGVLLDTEAIERFMARRAPGNSPLSTARKEADRPVFVSGLAGGRTARRSPRSYTIPTRGPEIMKNTGTCPGRATRIIPRA